MPLIALCHNRDLQKTNGKIIVLASGFIHLIQTDILVNMQLYLQPSKGLSSYLDYLLLSIFAISFDSSLNTSFFSRPTFVSFFSANCFSINLYL